jgi:phosphopantetheinyl transferase (holo-ACP synthase)
MRERRLRAHVSVSDESSYAATFVVVEQEDPR